MKVNVFPMWVAYVIIRLALPWPTNAAVLQEQLNPNELIKETVQRIPDENSRAFLKSCLQQVVQPAVRPGSRKLLVAGYTEGLPISETNG